MTIKSIHESKVRSLLERIKNVGEHLGPYDPPPRLEAALEHSEAILIDRGAFAGLLLELIELRPNTKRYGECLSELEKLVDRTTDDMLCQGIEEGWIPAE